jgi:hypothetical protein
LATMLCRWGANQNSAELTWGNSLEAENVSRSYKFILERFHEAIKSLARRLGISTGSEPG